MLPLLLLAFIVVPIAELAVIIRVGAWLGLLPTIALLLFDSLVGAVLVKREGRRAWDRFRRALAAGRWPGDEVVQGALVLIGGALLLTPGFITDVAGLLMVAAPSRAVASRLIRRRVRGRVLGPPHDARQHPPGSGRTLDVEVVSIEPDEPPER